MRLAIISDVHGNVRALEAVLADIRSRGVDATVNLGDCVAGPTWPRESFECLATLNVPTVRGNHDRWIVDRPTDGLPPAGRFAREALTQEQRNALFALPATLELEGGILATHGTPTDDSTYLTEESYDHRMIPAGRGGDLPENRAVRPQPSAERDTGSRRAADRQSGVRGLPGVRRHPHGTPLGATLPARTLRHPDAGGRKCARGDARAGIRLGGGGREGAGERVSEWAESLLTGAVG
jgi:predicted phosphodiesterase